MVKREFEYYRKEMGWFNALLYVSGLMICRIVLFPFILLWKLFKWTYEYDEK